MHELHHHAHDSHHHHTHAPDSYHGGGHHLLQVEGLSVGFRMYDTDASFFLAKQRFVEVVHDLSISVHSGEIVAVVGASGSGKSLLADTIMGIFEPNATVRGRVWFDGEPCDAEQLSRLRGNGISLVPQSIASLDPLMKVGRQVRGFGRAARGVQRGGRAARQRELFERYGLASSVEELYPHELSGGMARRVLLACALMDNPRVIIADEPTPGLDLELAVRALDDFRAFADGGGGVMLITHDIELALRVADRVAVFQDGTIVEETAVENFASPDTLQHPFTKELWHALFGSVRSNERPELADAAVAQCTPSCGSYPSSRPEGRFLGLSPQSGAPCAPSLTDVDRGDAAQLEEVCSEKGITHA
ncbi:ATP-binding cassette domain-containing protein [Adlercreutzia sp. ZJ141]|uniref:ATP-binding cassette domain-containing protein n=1 Tax=Adlercreutzia sp. ZJ141 TaxID=2709406 RepID=UPI001F14E52D|nr:ABC transporter ATP-binding protein [Adlercreutzia sp. ZJ141]